MTMAHQSSDRLTSADSAEALNVLVLDRNNNLANRNLLTDKDLVTVGPLRDGADQSRFMPSVVDSKTTFLSNAYSTEAQFHLEADKQGSFLPYLSAEGLESGFHGIYNETASLGFHGFRHSSQMPHRPYVPVSSQLPLVGDPSWLPTTRHFPTSDSSYHQPSVPLNIPNVTSKAQFSHLEFPVNIEQQLDGKRFGLRPNYLPPSGSYGGRSNFLGNSGKHCMQYQGFDGFGAAGFCSDCSKPFIGKSSLFQTSYPAASPKRVGSLEFPSNDIGMVNASAQFCGVAEMVGPVDFDKSVEYWLQDKWSGQFPVKWHIIKDVPNSQFRHILLENNDNKPVTNSRDTQEVELEQGIEMLNIFKNYESHSSILDDFYFYEERQKAMQERKARRLSSMVASPDDFVGESQNFVSLPNDFVKKMSKSFAEALLVNENEKTGGATRKMLSTACGGLGR
ncbi:Uncharacterized protein TCM_008783 isoform 2 [Theobroma cacao]|uniref:YTH domain-containing family protein n=1 Tax=Theobroma cacao TaxID=3641 RepID=A0A061EC21_THECC|nr:Uncharacterized protein TCM_008783 isoform 2 [Theobroma cacao]